MQMHYFILISEIIEVSPKYKAELRYQIQYKYIAYKSTYVLPVCAFIQNQRYRKHYPFSVKFEHKYKLRESHAGQPYSRLGIA